MRISPAKNVGVLISGRGSNMVAILDAIDRGQIVGQCGVVISNVASARGVMAAHARGIPVVVHPPRSFPNAAAFEAAILNTLREYRIEVVVLAGFMKVLGWKVVSAFPNHIINIHPSLLPAFPGLNPARQALEYGVRVSGCTVHLVDEGTDTGPIIHQASVPVLPEDTVDSLAERILAQEHRILPEALGWLLAGRLEVVDRVVRVHPAE